MATITPTPTGNAGGTLAGQVRWTIGDFRTVSRQTAVVESFLKDRTPGPLEVPEEEAEIRWGKPSTFTWSVTNPPGGFSPGGTVIGSNNDDDDGDADDPPGPKTLEFNETERHISTVTVTNPSDPEQYVVVERIEDITFSVPADMASALAELRDGTIPELFFKYILDHTGTNS